MVGCSIITRLGTYEERPKRDGSIRIRTTEPNTPDESETNESHHSPKYLYKFIKSSTVFKSTSNNFKLSSIITTPSLKHLQPTEVSLLPHKYQPTYSHM